MATVTPAKQTQTIETTYRPPAPSKLGSEATTAAALLGGVAAIWYIASTRKTATAATTTRTAATTTSTATGTASQTSPSLGIPGTPSILTQVGGTATSVIVTSNQVSGATQYNAYEYGTNLLLATSPSNVLVITGLQTNSGYEIYIRAQNALGELSAPSQPLLVKTGAGSPVVYINEGAPTTTTTSTAAATPSATTAVPSAPTGLRVTAVSLDSVVLNWNAVAGATSYPVLQVQSAAHWVQVADVTSPTVHIGGLQAGTTYTFIVQACNTAGCSGTSAAITVTTKVGLTAAGTPTTPTATPTYPTYATEQNWHAALAAAVGQITNEIPHVKTPTAAQLSAAVARLYPGFAQMNNLQQQQALQAANVGLLVSLNGLRTPPASAIYALAAALEADNGLQANSLDPYTQLHIQQVANIILMGRLNHFAVPAIPPVTAVGNASRAVLAQYGL